MGAAQPRLRSAVLANVSRSARLTFDPGEGLRTLAVLGALALALLSLPAAAHAARKRAPTPAPATVTIDGPGTGVTALTGMSIARDGLGGLVYVKQVGGVAHVFASVLSGGAFQAPVQVDAGLATPSSQPVIAAANDGLLLMAFINGGQLYVASTPGGGAALGAPAPIFAGAANPSLSISNFGKAYLAFTDTGGAGGGDVRCAYYSQGTWALESSPLDANPRDAAGAGPNRPEVATAGDGVAVVVWGEAGHVVSRRLVGTSPSVVSEQADPPTLDGWSEASVADPVVSVGGDSSYANIAFQETFANGSARQPRVLANRLHGSQYDGAQAVDGETTGGSEGADQPATVSTEYGDGFVTSERTSSHTLLAATMDHNESIQGIFRVDSVANGTAADAVPATAGLVSTLIAWQQSPGTSGPAEIRLRYAADGKSLADEQVASSPALGASNADAGLTAAGDVAGDAAVAWVQGSGADARIVAEQLFVPPGGFAPSDAFHYATTAQPVLKWSAASEEWGSPQYTVRVDGTAVAQTTATSVTLPSALSDGRHSYQITATNAAGVATASASAAIFVDTAPPRLTLRLTGRRVPHASLRAIVSYRDLPPAGQPQGRSSGVATIFIRWGDGTVTRIRRTSARHVYARRRRYTVTVIATDHAGNVTVESKRITIAPPKRKTARHPGHHRHGHRAASRTVR